jgi:hypothetical protein
MEFINPAARGYIEHIRMFIGVAVEDLCGTSKQRRQVSWIPKVFNQPRGHVNQPVSHVLNAYELLWYLHALKRINAEHRNGEYGRRNLVLMNHPQVRRKVTLALEFHCEQLLTTRTLHVGSCGLDNLVEVFSGKGLAPPNAIKQVLVMQAPCQKRIITTQRLVHIRKLKKRRDFSPSDTIGCALLRKVCMQ